jgi:uncharacterized damage-inducible protein DinB
MTQQYEFVKEARSVLLEYCKTIPPEELRIEHSTFGRGGSIRNLLVHIVNTYQFWIGNKALKKDIPFTAYDSIENIDQVQNVFDDVDLLLEEFIHMAEALENQCITYEINGLIAEVEPLKLFTHVITHEFHHKGQILAIGRLMGYIPVDTDIMR